MQQGYHERTISSLLDCLGEGAWNLTRYGSQFDPNTYRVSVQFAENTEEKRLNRMEQELGYGEESRSSVSGNTPEIKIDMTDVRAMLEAGGCENSMEAHSGVSKMTDAISTGESTVNPDCAVRNREKHMHTHLENCRLKGQIEEKEAETAALKSKVEELATNMAMLMSGVGGTPEQLLMRIQEISGRHSKLTPPTAPGDLSPAPRKAGVRFSESASPAHEGGSEESNKKPAACVTPAQQKRETGKQPVPEAEHKDVAMNLEEQASEEAQKRATEQDTDGGKGLANPKVMEELNSPPDTENVEGGTPV